MDIKKFELVLAFHELEIVTGSAAYYICNKDDSITKSKDCVFARIQDVGFNLSESYISTNKAVKDGEFIFYAVADTKEEAVQLVIDQWNTAHYGID